MVKFRNSQYCNLKLFLIFLVIYGHLIEPQIWQNDNLMTQYRWIYLVHMPLFSFLSGLFIKNCHSSVAQLKKLVPTYIVLQTMAVALGNGIVEPMTPYWHLWYIFSCTCWIGIAWMWFHYARGNGKIIILILSVTISCLAGYIKTIGREYSLSRTIVFFPYFWMGIICDKNFEWVKYRISGVIALLISIIVMYFTGDKLSTTFLYQANPFKTENGVMIRLLCYLLGMLLGFFLLTCIPNKRYCFTKAGANTITAYILHVSIVGLLRESDWSGWIYICVSVIFLWLIYKLFQWHSPMYGILVPEMRSKQYSHFR